MTEEVNSAIRGLFSYETVSMTVILGLLGWGALQVGHLNHDVSVIQVQQLEHDETGKLVRDMRDVLIRVEEGQRNIAKEVMILRDYAAKHSTMDHN